MAYVFFTRTLAAIVTAVGLAACTGYAPSEPRYQTAIPAGSTLLLERELAVQPGRTRVYLQDGRVLEPALVPGASRFRPRCWLRVGPTPDSSAYTIRPDRFPTGEMRRQVHAGRNPAGQWTVASRSLAGIRLAEGKGGGPGFLTHELTIPLNADDQPEVRELGCRVDYRVGGTREIGRHTIEQALGEVASLGTSD